MGCPAFQSYSIGFQLSHVLPLHHCVSQAGADIFHQCPREGDFLTDTVLLLVCDSRKEGLQERDLRMMTKGNLSLLIMVFLERLCNTDGA